MCTQVGLYVDLQSNQIFNFFVCGPPLTSMYIYSRNHYFGNISKRGMFGCFAGKATESDRAVLIKLGSTRNQVVSFTLLHCSPSNLISSPQC